MIAGKGLRDLSAPVFAAARTHLTEYALPLSVERHCGKVSILLKDDDRVSLCRDQIP